MRGTSPAGRANVSEVIWTPPFNGAGRKPDQPVRKALPAALRFPAGTGLGSPPVATVWFAGAIKGGRRFGR